MRPTRIKYLCHEQLATLYEKRSDYKSALAHFRQYHTLKEKIFNLDNMQQVANLTAVHQLETAMKDAEILRLKNTFLVQEIEVKSGGMPNWSILPPPIR